MSTTNDSSGCSNAAPTGGPPVTITVLRTNLALVQPPVEQLQPLLQYRNFFLDSEKIARERFGERASEDLLAPPHSVVPAGLVARFNETLTAHGYQVTVADKRRFGKAFRIKKELCHTVPGEPWNCLRSAVRRPLGQVIYRSGYDLLRCMEFMICRYPKARILAVYHKGEDAIEDYFTHLRQYNRRFGLIARQQDRPCSQSLVTGVRWLCFQPPRRWDIVLWAVWDSSNVSETNCKLLLRLRARRLYAFVYEPEPWNSRHWIALNKRKQLWLEALAGHPIAPPKSA
jgi:hypothetical protein